jgi:hypothetical protein
VESDCANALPANTETKTKRKIRLITLVNGANVLVFSYSNVKKGLKRRLDDVQMSRCANMQMRKCADVVKCQ